MLRWAALLWALAFAGPYVTLAIQSLLDRMGLPPITVGVTTIGFAAASLALWKAALQRRTAGAR